MAISITESSDGLRVCVCACFGVINWSGIFIAAGIGFCKHPVSLSQRPLNTHTHLFPSHMLRLNGQR